MTYTKEAHLSSLVVAGNSGSAQLLGTLAVLTLGMMLFALPSAVAQQNVPQSSGTAISHPTAVERLSEAGAQEKALARHSGTWDVTFISWASPGAAPTTVTGLVAERTMYGPMLQEVLRSTAQTPGAQFVRVDNLTFNHIESRWDYMSMDSRAPVGLMPAWSLAADTSDRIFLSFQPFSMPGDGPGVSGQMMRMEQVIRYTDDDHDAKDQYFMPADGKGTKWLAKRYSYTRRSH